MKGHSYILKNITRRDVNLGDLRIKVPAGKCRDLLGKKSHITVEDIVMSEKNGSIFRCLGRSLIKVEKIVEARAPLREMEIDPSAVTFPRRMKSSIIIEMGDLDEEIKDLIVNEDEEYLKQLELENQNEGDGTVPVIAKE